MAGIGLCVGLTGCEQTDGRIVKEVVNTAGDVLICIGNLVEEKVKSIPGKIVGLALIVLGNVLKVYVATGSGEKEVNIALTDEQSQKLQKAMSAGQKVTVKQTDGTKEAINWRPEVTSFSGGAQACSYQDINQAAAKPFRYDSKGRLMVP
jgi:hypothetical protein